MNVEIKDHWETLVVGGGITGIGIFRDLCLHGNDALLIDKYDFSSQTSQSSSKMLHGGIRYLATMDFPLVYEALGEKNLWFKLAPHLVREKAFVLPIYSYSKRPLWMIRIGFFLYDLLSKFQNTPHKILSSKEVVRHFPGIETQGLKGGGLYHDAVMNDAKMALEVLYDALERKKTNLALNYVGLTRVHPKGDTYECLLTDTLTGREWTVTCHDLVVATGPFTDRFLGGISFIRWKDKLLASKGGHIYLRRDALAIDHAMVLTAKAQGKGERIIFLIPCQEKILVGTTETEATGDFFNSTINPDERDYLLEQVNLHFPKAKLSCADILSDFSGIRPLVRQEGQTSSSHTSRRHKIYRPRSNLFVLMGGKYTTFRIMAQDLMRSLFSKKRQCYHAHLSLSPLLKKSVFSFFENSSITPSDIEKIIETEFPRTLDDLMIRRIGIRSYRDSSIDFKGAVARTPLVKSLYTNEEMEKRWF